MVVPQFYPHEYGVDPGAAPLYQTGGTYPQMYQVSQPSVATAANVGTVPQLHQTNGLPMPQYVHQRSESSSSASQLFSNHSSVQGTEVSAAPIHPDDYATPPPYLNKN